MEIMELSRRLGVPIGYNYNAKITRMIGINWRPCLMYLAPILPRAGEKRLAKNLLVIVVQVDPAKPARLKKSPAGHLDLSLSLGEGDQQRSQANGGNSSSGRARWLRGAGYRL
jgi:hypothetical protein